MRSPTPIIEKRPPWFSRFTRLIKRVWAHHGPCNGVYLSSAFDTDSNEWLIVAAPIFQEVFGGEDDGMIVWTGFVFHTEKLLRAMAVESVSGGICLPSLELMRPSRVSPLAGAQPAM